MKKSENTNFNELYKNTTWLPFYTSQRDLWSLESLNMCALYTMYIIYIAYQYDELDGI